MLPGKPVSKCAILADPREPQKEKEIVGVINEILPLLKKYGIAVEVFLGIPVDEIYPSKDVDLCLVLGGDGTMIHFAARLAKYKVPFYGLNYGHAGFMMNNPASGLEHHISKLKEAAFSMCEFPTLKVISTDLKGEVHEGVGLNDIYVQRMTAQSCKINVVLGSHPLEINPVLCDGVIVSTPLGSTAYSYNVTGAMIAIDTPVISLTPVAANRSCPVSSIVLPEQTPLRFEVLEPKKRRVQVVSDGHNHGDLTHAVVHISPYRVPICFDLVPNQDLPMRLINKACTNN